MLFSLSNLKRRALRDPEGNQAIMPKLLHGRSTLKLVEQAIDHFESFVGKPRSEYDSRALEAIMGDYRLGRCIEACLLTRYVFIQPQLDSVLSQEQIDALQARSLSGPSEVRFALWDAVNEHYGGFAPPESRAELLAALAREWELPPEPILIDTLLTLDSDTMAILTRTDDIPTPHEIVLQYNRGAVR